MNKKKIDGRCLMCGEVWKNDPLEHIKCFNEGIEILWKSPEPTRSPESRPTDTGTSQGK